MDNIEEKFEQNVFKNLNKENFNKIIEFLKKENCDCIEDIISDYLDLFLISYEEFIKKYNILNENYNNKFLKKVSEDMNLLEEFYNL